MCGSEDFESDEDETLTEEQEAVIESIKKGVNNYSTIVTTILSLGFIGAGVGVIVTNSGPNEDMVSSYISGGIYTLLGIITLVEVFRSNAKKG